MSELDKQICSLAEDYVINQHYRAGSRSYAWEETDYRSSDLDEEEIVTGECPPSDAGHYSWWEIVSSEIEDSEITERNDETGEYSVTVNAWIAVSSGDEDEEVDENVAADLRSLYVQIDRDDEGDFQVVGIEE